MLVYLGICAVIAFLGAAAATFFTVPPAPIFHIAFAAGAMPLIFGAIIHFVPVLTRSGATTAGIRVLPLVVQFAGIPVPLALGGVWPDWLLHPAATVVALAALVLLIWTTRRLRATLGAPHPGARWYGAALLCLFFAVSLVPIWLALPDLRPALRLFHLHLNTLGFIALAAFGTLPVLLPTAMRQTDPLAGARLRADLLPATVGALLVAAGATGTMGTGWLALPGAILLAWMALRTLRAWWTTYREKVGAGGTAPLFAATAGFLLLLLAGIAHAAGLVEARPALAAYVALFLLPLVTGALAQLLPVWQHPGRDSPRRRRLAGRLERGSRLRTGLFLVSGGLMLAGLPGGSSLATAGLLLFATRLTVAFWLDRAECSDDNSRPVQP